MSEPYENLEIQPVESTELPKRNVFSWKCEKGFFVGLICMVIVAVLLFAVTGFSLIVIAQPLLVWSIVILLNHIIFFAGMKIGGIFAITICMVLLHIFFWSVWLVVYRPFTMQMHDLGTVIAYIIIFIMPTIIWSPLRVLLMGAVLCFAGQRGWFDGKSFVVHVCSMVIIMTVVDFGFDKIVTRTPATVSNYGWMMLSVLIQSAGCIIGYWIGKRILERIEARFGLQNEI